MKSVTDLRLRKPDRGKDTGKRSKGNKSSYYDKQYERKSAYGNKDANSKQTRKTYFNKWSQDNSKSSDKKGSQPQLLVQISQVEKTTKLTAGSLRHAIKMWQRITTDQFILQTIQGYRLEFFAVPHK